MPQEVRWNEPDGGMFLWLQLPAYINTLPLLDKAVARNVAFVPGAAFYADHPQHNTLRLSFVTASVEQINTGVAALALTLKEALSA
jgi:2-aminoadipate transaminase